MSKTYSAGIVTAYGAAKRAGYQGTYEDFCRQQAGYAGNAAAVEAAKTAAQTARNQAQTAKDDAVTAKNTAVSAKDDAVSAKNTAVSAKDDAVSAKNTASTKAQEASASATSAGLSATSASQSAQNAEQSAQGVSGSLAQIQTNKEDIDTLKADLDNVASPSINLFNPAIEAKQGYLSPKSGLDASTLIPALDTSASSSYSLIMTAFKVTAGETYAFPKTFVGRLSTFTGTAVNGYYGRSGYVANTKMTEKTDCLMWTVPNNIAYFCMHIWKPDGVTQDVINNFMIIKVDDAETFVWPTNYVSYGLTANYNVLVGKIVDYDVKGHDEALETDLQTKAGRRILNLYNSADTLTTGYSIGTTADIANMEPTGLTSKSNYATSMRLIEVAGGSTICVSKDFVGQLGAYNPSGGRSGAFDRNEMTYENNCLKYTIPSTHTKYYIGVAFNTSNYTDYAHFVLAVDVSSLPDEFIPHTDYCLDNSVKVFAENVIGAIDADDEMKFAYALDDFNEAYASRVQETQGPNCFTLTFKTDSHVDANDWSERTENSLKNASETGYVGDYLGQDLIAHGGDILTYGYTDKTIPIHNLRVFLNRMYKFTKAPFVVAKGNHDDNRYDTQLTVNNVSASALIMPQEWNAIAMQFAKKFAVCPIAGRANYCYIDNERTKIRTFILDTEDFDYHVMDGTAEVNSAQAFSNDQLNFVANALLFSDKTDPDEWAALFISHRPLDTTTTSGKRMGEADALIRNVSIMLNIINAYRDGTSYSASGYGGNNQTEIDSHYYPYNVSIDYTAKGQGEVIALIFGHVHVCNTSDEVGENSSAKSYGYRYIGCGSESFYTLVFNRDTKNINVYFYAGDKSKVQLPVSGMIQGLTENDLNSYGDWSTSWS